MRYEAIVFDLFGTVALFEQEKLPVFEWKGHTRRSTLGELRKLVGEAIPDMSFETFYKAMSEINQELTDSREHDLRETQSAVRFTRTLVRAGLADSAETHCLGEILSMEHMTLLAKATVVPPEHRRLLKRVGKVYKVGLVSNFDHGPTARRVIEEGGVTNCFSGTVISAEHGWRKPHPKIFSDALTELNVDPSTALFVGDSPTDDIVGASAVGMDVAWINESQRTLPDKIPQPRYDIRAIPELEHILGL